MGIQLLFQIAVFLFSVVLHELAHGWAALALGDPTAKREGRLTLNPISHMDPVGSFLLPSLSFISGFPVLFGWAKPVPVQPSYFKNPLKDMAKVAMAGPAMNLSIVIVAGVILRLFPGYWTWFLVPYVIQINLVLALFNLFPIPPLDGSRLLMYVGPASWRPFLHKIEPFGFVLIFVLAYLGFFSFVLQFVAPLILRLILGSSI